MTIQSTINVIKTTRSASLNVCSTDLYLGYIILYLPINVQLPNRLEKECLSLQLCHGQTMYISCYLHV